MRNYPKIILQFLFCFFLLFQLALQATDHDHTPAPVVNTLPLNQTICSGQTTSILLLSPLAGTTFTWTNVSKDVLGASDGSGDLISQTLTTTSDTYGTVDYIITPITPDGFLGASTTLTVTVNPLPIAKAKSRYSICSGQTTNIRLTSNFDGTTFTWKVLQKNVSGASHGSGKVIMQTLTTNSTPSGTAVYKVTPITPNGCKGAPIKVTVKVKANCSSMTFNHKE